MTLLFLSLSHFSDNYLSLFLVCFVVIISVISALRMLLKKTNKESPIDALQKKFTKGEIANYEFEQRKRQLQKDEDLKLRSFFLSCK